LETLRLWPVVSRVVAVRGPAGGKADDQGESWTIARGPGTEPASSVEWIGQDTSGRLAL